MKTTKTKSVERILAEEYRKRGEFYDKVNDLYQRWLVALASGNPKPLNDEFDKLAFETYKKVTGAPMPVMKWLWKDFRRNVSRNKLDPFGGMMTAHRLNNRVKAKTGATGNGHVPKNRIKKFAAVVAAPTKPEPPKTIYVKGIPFTDEEIGKMDLDSRLTLVALQCDDIVEIAKTIGGAR
jgi:hypothetical protein